MAFDKLRQPACADLSKLAWWNDEDLKALSTRAVRAAPNKEVGHTMRALVLCGMEEALGVGASLGSGVQGGSHTLRAVGGVEQCSSGQGRAQRDSGPVTQRGRGKRAVKDENRCPLSAPAPPSASGEV